MAITMLTEYWSNLSSWPHVYLPSLNWMCFIRSVVLLNLFVLSFWHNVYYCFTRIIISHDNLNKNYPRVAIQWCVGPGLVSARRIVGDSKKDEFDIQFNHFILCFEYSDFIKLYCSSNKCWCLLRPMFFTNKVTSGW